MHNVIMYYLNFFFSCSIRNLTIASLFTIKVYVFSLLQLLIPTVVYFDENNTENQLYDFLINSRHSCKKYCLHNFTL